MIPGAVPEVTVPALATPSLLTLIVYGSAERHLDSEAFQVVPVIQVAVKSLFVLISDSDVVFINALNVILLGPCHILKTVPVGDDRGSE